VLLNLSEIDLLSDSKTSSVISNQKSPEKKEADKSIVPVSPKIKDFSCKRGETKRDDKTQYVFTG